MCTMSEDATDNYAATRPPGDVQGATPPQNPSGRWASAPVTPSHTFVWLCERVYIITFYYYYSRHAQKIGFGPLYFHPPGQKQSHCRFTGGPRPWLDPGPLLTDLPRGVLRSGVLFLGSLLFVARNVARVLCLKCPPPPLCLSPPSRTV